MPIIRFNANEKLVKELKENCQTRQISEFIREAVQEKLNKLTFPPKTSAFYRRKLAKYRGLG